MLIRFIMTLNTVLCLHLCKKAIKDDFQSMWLDLGYRHSKFQMLKSGKTSGGGGGGVTSYISEYGDVRAF